MLEERSSDEQLRCVCGICVEDDRADGGIGGGQAAAEYQIAKQGVDTQDQELNDVQKVRAAYTVTKERSGGSQQPADWPPLRPSRKVGDSFVPEVTPSHCKRWAYYGKIVLIKAKRSKPQIMSQIAD